jgi:hypothetical protein
MINVILFYCILAALDMVFGRIKAKRGAREISCKNSNWITSVEIYIIRKLLQKPVIVFEG